MIILLSTVSISLIIFGGKHSFKGWLLLFATHTLISSILSDDKPDDKNIPIEAQAHRDTIVDSASNYVPATNKYVTDTGNTLIWDNTEDIWD